MLPHILLAMLAGWIQRHQQQVISYLIEENRVLKAQLSHKRLRLTDTERRRLAALAHPLGRARLKEMATIATPATLMRWYQRLIAQKGVVKLTFPLLSSWPIWHTRRMNALPPTTLYKRHRFPAEIISHCVWLYFRFCLSYRDVEELMAERGISLTYEAVRYWCRKFGQAYANQLRHRRPRPGDKWHLDEVFPTIRGEQHYLWRAVDQEGNILDILVQRQRNKKAAKKFFCKLLKGLRYAPRVIITDKLRSYGAAKREILPSVEHRQHRYLNNRAENSHQL